MKYYLETINEFETILNCLDSNNNNIIRALSLFAEEHKENDIIAPAFVNLITTKIIEAPQNLKIYFLYVLDCIVKNVGYLYIKLFSKSLKEVFIFSISSLFDIKEREKYYLMRKSWENHFSDEILNDIDNSLDKIDPIWRNKSSEFGIISNISSNNYETLQSLPIVSLKLKSESWKENKNIDYDKENIEMESQTINQTRWTVDIPDYPLFPDIGTDPRLLRQWYSNETNQKIVINNNNYELLLNRIQPCIFINETLHAVRFQCKKLQLFVNGNIFDIAISGPSVIEICNETFYICLGGPWHELVLLGLPFHVPIDGQRHRVRFNNDNVFLQWLISGPIQICVMPAIPSHIGEWGWRGMFGSPKLLMQRPLNPMKPPETFMRIRNGKSNRFDKREFWKTDKPCKVCKTPLELKRLNSSQTNTDDSDNNNNNINSCGLECLDNNNVKADILSLKLRQKLNREAICQLYSSRLCSICSQTFNYTDDVDFNMHMLQHCSSKRRCYQLLNDWIISNFVTDSVLNVNNDNMVVDCCDQIPGERQVAKTIPFDELVNLEVTFELESKNGNRLILNSEEMIRFYCVNKVRIHLYKGTAEIYGTALPFNHEVELTKNNHYEILSFTGCKIMLFGNINEVKIKSIRFDHYKPNIILNVHYDMELKRIEASKIDVRGPRILIYGPGVEAFSMSTLTRTLTNYSVRCGRTVALVNLDTTYNDTGLPNSISVNVIQAEFDLLHGWDFFNDPLVFNFGQCSPVANQRLYNEQLDALANFVNIRCENDNNLLIGGCIINGGSFHSSEIILKAIKLFEVNLLLLISDSNKINLSSQVPEYVQIINIPKELFDTNFCPEKIESIRIERIQSYFYGKHKLFKHELKAEEVQIYYTKSLNDSNDSNFIKIPFQEILINSVGALSQALSYDQICTSPILFFLLITDVSENNSTLTIKTEREFWPEFHSTILLNGLVLEKK